MLTIRSEVVHPIAGYALVALTLILGLFPIRSCMHFLRNAEELLRQIQLEAMAIGFSGGIVFILTWRLLELLGAPEIGGSVSASIFVLIWALGQRLGIQRYKSVY